MHVLKIQLNFSKQSNPSAFLYYLTQHLNPLAHCPCANLAVLLVLLFEPGLGTGHALPTPRVFGDTGTTIHLHTSLPGMSGSGGAALMVLWWCHCLGTACQPTWVKAAGTGAPELLAACHQMLPACRAHWESKKAVSINLHCPVDKLGKHVNFFPESSAL